MTRIIILVLFISVLIILPAFSEKENEDKDLVQITMKADIDTASYYELKTWAERLELDTTGSKEELKKKLYSYYEIESVPEDNISGTGNSIIIKSAKELDYITIEEIDENYVILSGRVYLELIDSKNNTSHKIYADKIIFNQSEKTVTASGSITYIIDNNKTKEYFYGESLTFNVDSWEGMFFKGISEKNKKVGDNNVTFYFSGKEIYRKSGDKVILVDGSISSSREKNPYYHLKASKIWVLNPGEWAIKNSVLYVGRIPVFAFPFLYMPGDKLIFHPIYGFEDKNGYFINTTTYLIGQQKDNPSHNLSFLQSSNKEGENTLLKREGLFLRKTNIPIPEQSSYIKLLGDYYTRKGLFLGIEGSLQDIGIIKSLTFFTGTGFNRYIYTDPLYGYTPYLLDSDSGKYLPVWQNPYFLGSELPFRFALDIGLTVNVNDLNIILALPVYSDPSFSSDFLNRKENFDFKSLFDKDSATEENSSDTKDTISWNLTMNWKINTGKISPFIKDVSIDKLKFDLSFLSTQLLYDTTPYDPLRFYYPQNFTYPDFSGTLKGSIFNFDTMQKKEPPDGSEEKMLTPWEIQENEKNTDEKDLISPPDFSDDIALPGNFQYSGITQSLSYSIIPRLTMNSILNSTSPTVPEETEIIPDYSLLSFQNSSSLFYSLTVSDKLLEVDSKAVFKVSYKSHFSRSESFSGDWDTFTEQDKVYSNYDVTNTTKITSYPFLGIDSFSQSVINYSINTVLFKHYYDQTESVYSDSMVTWNTNDITNHQLELTAVYKPGKDAQSLGLRLKLPPYAPELYPNLKLSWGAFSSEISTGFKKPEDSDNWEMDPLIILGKYSFSETSFLAETFSLDDKNKQHFSTTEMNLNIPDNSLSFKQSFKYDLNNKEPENSLTSLQYYAFTSSFSAERVKGYTFNPSTGWILDDKELFQPSKASLGLHYNYNPDPFWKNRIRIKSDINSSWSMNLLKPTDTSFNFKLSFTLSIAEFLDLNFKSESVNRAFYRYIPGFSEEVGLANTVNPFEDLLKSFNFFNKNDRVASNFNLSLLDITAVHHMKDWDLNLTYSGKPEKDDTSKQYIWESSFSIFLIWKPIPEIKKEIAISNDEIVF